MNSDNTDWGKSVTGVVIHNGKVLLARHTYGGGAGKLIIPGGYLEKGETPQEALVREYMEETNVIVKPQDIIGIRFTAKDWYIAFRAEYVSGTPKPDNEENCEVLWVDVDEALKRDDVPDLTKKLIQSAVAHDEGLKFTEYKSNMNPPFSLYC